MDEIFARRDMLSPLQLRELSRKSDARGLLQVASHGGAIALTGWALHALWGTWLAVPLFLCHGVLINFLYAGQHELSHWTVFRTRWPNMLCGRIIGFVLIYPRDFDQIQHMAHHRHTSVWGEDGELERPPYDRTSYLLWLLGPSYWSSRIARIARLARGVVRERYIPEARKAAIVREARWHVAGYAAIAGVSVAAGSWAAVSYWLAPMLLTKVVHQLQNTIEHLGLPHVGDITRNTRSTRTNALMRWLCWNMPYHTAHHAFPGVPFHRLPALDKALFTDRGRRPPEMTYWAFQTAVLRALSQGRTEADFPDDAVWIGPAGGTIEQAKAVEARA